MNLEAFEAVVIGGSAGSLEALSQILPALPSDFPLPIMIVVHVPPDKKSALAEVIQAKCALTVREAEDKERIVAGRVYFAAPDYHLLVEENRCLAFSCDAPILFSRPSIDVLFESASDVFGDRLIGIVLSGANDDGSRGLQAIVAEGGTALVQAPEGAYARAMPLAALERCPDAHILKPAEIAAILTGRTLI